MSITKGYATLAELREKLSLTAANTAANTQLEQIIEASSRWIDRYCGRRFYGVPETRYYTADDGYEIQIDDLRGTPTIKTDDNGDGVYENTWAATDYNLKYGENYNAALDDKPYTQIEVSEGGTYAFPTNVKKGVLVYGTHGYVASTLSYSACPDPIHDAALLLSERIYKRKDAPLGVAGGSALGQVPVRVPSMSGDPDIKDLLDPYRRRR